MTKIFFFNVILELWIFKNGTVGMVSSEFGKDNFDEIYNIFKNLIFCYIYLLLWLFYFKYTCLKFV